MRNRWESLENPRKMNENAWKDDEFAWKSTIPKDLCSCIDYVGLQHIPEHKSMEICVNSMEIHGKSLKIHAKSMKIDENPLKMMIFKGILDI